MKTAMLIALCAALAPMAVPAQVVLPDVIVHNDEKAVVRHGGYVISGDFEVDPKISSVIYPTEALHAGDVLSIKPSRMDGDEYLVLQECVSANCLESRLVRVQGPGMGELRFIVPHEGKYFIWMKQIRAGPAPSGTGERFTEFRTFGPPLTVSPVGTLVAYSKMQVAEAESASPIAVKMSKKEHATFVATFSQVPSYESSACMQTVSLRRVATEHSDVSKVYRGSC